MQDGGIQDGSIELKMAVSQIRLNLERVCVRFYGSINPIESVKLPSVNYLDESKLATSNMSVSKMASFCCLASKHRFVPQLHLTTILEGNIGNCRYHFESIILVVCGFQTFMNVLLQAIGTRVRGIKQNCHFKDRLW